MSRYFSASILLERPWPLDMDRIARAISDRFPEIGEIDAVFGQADADTGVLTIDHAQVVLRSTDDRVGEDAYVPPLRILRAWDPWPAIRCHNAHLRISCGGRLSGLEGALAYAAATHLVAAAVAGIAGPRAVLWEPARALVEPGDFAIGAETILTGAAPLMSWLSYAPIVPEGHVPASATGMVTYGLKPFLGRELELAPRPGDPRAAYRCLGSVVRRLMEGRMDLCDGQRLIDEEAGVSLTVRERRYWLRRDESVFVLVAEDSVVDPRTLQPRAERVA